MKKFAAKKVNMTQLWKNDAVMGVTVLKLINKSDHEPFFSSLKEGDKVVVSAMSKGKGFQGVVKRHGFHGGPKTHGQKDRLRAPGSLGPTAPQRVLKGRKMAGHMGNERVTIKNIKIAHLDAEKETVAVWGSVPGMRGTKVELRV